MSLKEVLWGTQKEVQAGLKISQLNRRSTLNIKQKEDLAEAKRLSRRLFIRRGATIVGGALVLGTPVGAFLLNKSFNSDGLPNLEPGVEWFKVEDEQLIGKERVNIAVKAAQDWDSNYQCERDVTLKYIQSVESVAGDGSIRSFDEKAEPGIIYLTPRGDARKIILHAMTHACKPDQPTLLPEPFVILDGNSEVYGYHGLALLVRDIKRKSTMFTLFEEGMAERNAFYFPGYTYAGINYGNVGRLTTSKFPKEQYPQAENWVKTNNVPAFVNSLLSLPANHAITAPDLEEAMFRYAQAWNLR